MIQWFSLDETEKNSLYCLGFSNPVNVQALAHLEVQAEQRLPHQQG